MSVCVDSCWICGRKFYRSSNKCIFHSLPIFSCQRFLLRVLLLSMLGAEWTTTSLGCSFTHLIYQLRVLLLSKLGAEWAKTSLGCSFTHLIYQLRVLLLSKLGADWAKTSLVALLLIWYTNYACYFFRSSEQNEQKSHWLLFYSFDMPTCYCTTIWNRLLHNTSQINSWGYYLWFHFLRLSERYLQTLPFSSLQRFKLTDLPLMSTTLKLQTDVTSSIYPSFLIFFASMPPISPSTFFASIVDKIFPQKFNFHDVIPHYYS